MEGMPCTIRQVKTSRPVMSFHDFDAFEQLVAAAQAVDANTHLIVLLGGEAGLRCGEMMALEWSDVEATGYLSVVRSEWRGQVTVPKGGRGRRLRLTVRLQKALRNYRHLPSPRVLCEHTGVHALRHTFCSHLVMRGAVPQQVQELAGHEDLSTTQRYMHLSPEAVDSAIQLLDQPVPAWAAES